MLAEFADYLETRTSPRTKRPYEHSTINAYVLPARNLDEWMTARGIGGDFTDADTALLNRYFREYYDEHGQGGTHTLQRNLIQLFNFLRDEHGHPTRTPISSAATPRNEGGPGHCPPSSSATCSR